MVRCAAHQGGGNSPAAAFLTGKQLMPHQPVRTMPAAVTRHGRRARRLIGRGKWPGC